MKGSIATMPLIQVNEIYKSERYIIDSVPHVFHVLIVWAVVRFLDPPLPLTLTAHQAASVN